MSRAVIIGGFGVGEASVEAAGEAFGNYYEEVLPYTFSEAMKRPHELEMAMEDAHVKTQSAGLLAGTRALLLGEGARKPNRIDADEPPLQTTIVDLFEGTGEKTLRMHTPGIGINSPGDALSVARFDTSSIGELVTHPGANFRNIRRITRFDSVEAARWLAANGISVILKYRSGGTYFDLSEAQEAHAIDGGVEIERLDGEHDQLFLTPDDVVREDMAGTSPGRRHFGRLAASLTQVRDSNALIATPAEAA